MGMVEPKETNKTQRLRNVWAPQKEKEPKPWLAFEQLTKTYTGGIHHIAYL